MKKSNKLARSIGVGVAIGTAIGVALKSIPIGVGIGVVFAAAFINKSKINSLRNGQEKGICATNR